MAHRPLPHNGMSVTFKARLWHHTGRPHPRYIRPRHAAGALLLILRAHHLKLQRHDAAGNLRHLVLRSVHHAALGTIHTDTLHATLGIPIYLRQPHALLHRRHTHRLHSRRRLRRDSASDTRTHHHRTHYELMGRSQLQEKQLISLSHFSILG